MAVSLPAVSLIKAGAKWPFSRGLVAESLVTAGIDAQAAAVLARRLEQELIDQGRLEITPADLSEFIALRLASEHGEEAARVFRSQTPAFEDVQVQTGDRTVIFSKGVLTRSLEQSGIPLGDAYAVAKAVELDLRVAGRQVVPASELASYVGATLERSLGAEARERYQNRLQAITEIAVTDDASGRITFPYSKGILAQSLMALGLSPVQAHSLARELEQRLWSARQTVITREDLRAMVADTLRREFGEEVARRYLVMRSVRRPLKPIAILIGGVTGVGKSALATEVAYRLGITRIVSTDSVRQVMRALVPADLSPSLHASTYDAWEAMLAPYERRRTQQATPELVIRGFADQVQQVSVGVRAIIKRAVDEHTSIVVEGVHVVPGFLSSDLFKGATAVTLVVSIADPERHRRHFYLRDRETNSKRPMADYIDHLEEIRWMQSHVVDLARSQRVPVLEGADLDRAADEMVGIIADRVVRAHSNPPHPAPHPERARGP